ncbi:hypothetical protein, partial [Streptomyces sp. NPDC017890]|uniref:hypothetical protein n=2 Tax=Streptomycetaceae TaxID=2062 RepID=UPI0037A8224F
RCGVPFRVADDHLPKMIDCAGQRRGIPFSGVRFFASQKFRFERTLAESRNTGTADLWCTNENQVATCDRAARVVAVQDFGFRFGLVSVAT